MRNWRLGRAGRTAGKRSHGATHVGADSISARSVYGRTVYGGMRASRPTFARKVVAVLFSRALAVVCRGGPWPSRRPYGDAWFPGTMQASSPTQVRGAARVAPSQLAVSPTAARRGGFHIRPVCGGAGVAGVACPSPTDRGKRPACPRGKRRIPPPPLNS